MPVPCYLGHGWVRVISAPLQGWARLATSSSHPCAEPGSEVVRPQSPHGFLVCALNSGQPLGKPRGPVFSLRPVSVSVVLVVALFICSCPQCLAPKTQLLSVARSASPGRASPRSPHRLLRPLRPQTRETHKHKKCAFVIKGAECLSHPCVLCVFETPRSPASCPRAVSSGL